MYELNDELHQDDINLDTEEQEYRELVYLTFSTPQGQKLLEHFKKYLMKPNWFPHEEPHVGLYREGSCQFIRELIQDIEIGRVYIKGESLTQGE